MIIIKSCLLSNSSMKNSVNLFLKPAGNSFFPTSVAGFIQAKRRKSGCLLMGLLSPRSSRVSEPALDSRSPDKHSKVSALARLISSNSTHSPRKFQVIIVFQICEPFLKSDSNKMYTVVYDCISRSTVKPQNSNYTLTL